MLFLHKYFQCLEFFIDLNPAAAGSDFWMKLGEPNKLIDKMIMKWDKARYHILLIFSSI